MTFFYSNALVSSSLRRPSLLVFNIAPHLIINHRVHRTPLSLPFMIRCMLPSASTTIAPPSQSCPSFSPQSSRSLHSVVAALHQSLDYSIQLVKQLACSTHSISSLYSKSSTVICLLPSTTIASPSAQTVDILALHTVPLISLFCLPRWSFNRPPQISLLVVSTTTSSADYCGL